jgi:hypothetical protein
MARTVAIVLCHTGNRVPVFQRVRRENSAVRSHPTLSMKVLNQHQIIDVLV